MNIYEINKNTLALIPINKEKTKIIEKEKSYIIDSNIMKIINNSCTSFGSSYKGRFDSTKKLIGVSYKAPIIIEESNGIIYFPTTSPKQDNCCWLSLNHIKNYYKENNYIYIVFDTEFSMKLELSLNSFNNQYLNALKLYNLIKNKIQNF